MARLKEIEHTISSLCPQLTRVENVGADLVSARLRILSIRADTRSAPTAGSHAGGRKVQARAWSFHNLYTFSQCHSGRDIGLQAEARAQL